VRTCVGLARGVLTDQRLKDISRGIAQQFAQDPAAIHMQASSQDSHVLFTVTPNADRSFYTLNVTTPYLRGLVLQEIAKRDVTEQVSFYHRASSLSQFRGTLGYLLEKYFIAWLYSGERAKALLCASKPAMSAKSKGLESAMTISLQPPPRNKLTVSDGVTGFAKVKESDTPFAWVPASRSFPTFDAVICSDEHIFTIQVTTSHTHSMKLDGFTQLKQNLPDTFQEKRVFCHVLVTDCPKKADALRKQHRKLAAENNILIYSAVLEVSTGNFSSEGLKHISVCRCNHCILTEEVT